MDVETGNWSDGWIVYPGEAGKAAMQNPFNGHLIFDFATESKYFLSSLGVEFAKCISMGTNRMCFLTANTTAVMPTPFSQVRFRFQPKH